MSFIATVRMSEIQIDPDTLIKITDFCSEKSLPKLPFVASLGNHNIPRISRDGWLNTPTRWLFFGGSVNCRYLVFTDHSFWSYVHQLSPGWWFEPLWKIWMSIGMIIPNIWENKQWQPNHQPMDGWSTSYSLQASSTIHELPRPGAVFRAKLLRIFWLLGDRNWTFWKTPNLVRNEGNFW